MAVAVFVDMAGTSWGKVYHMGFSNSDLPQQKGF